MAKVITNLFDPPKPKIEPLPPPVKVDNTAVQEAAKEEKTERRRRGRGQTILTGNALLDGTSEEPLISRPKLGDK